jgi:hypothetical protein
VAKNTTNQQLERLEELSELRILAVVAGDPETVAELAAQSIACVRQLMRMSLEKIQPDPVQEFQPPILQENEGQHEKAMPSPSRSRRS